MWGAPRLFLQELDAALLAIAEHPEIGHRLALHRYPNARSFVLQRARLRRPLHHRSGRRGGHRVRVSRGKRRPLKRR
jgi:hypothetical protein